MPLLVERTARIASGSEQRRPRSAAGDGGPRPLSQATIGIPETPRPPAPGRPGRRPQGGGRLREREPGLRIAPRTFRRPNGSWCVSRDRLFASRRRARMDTKPHRRSRARHPGRPARTRQRGRLLLADYHGPCRGWFLLVLRRLRPAPWRPGEEVILTYRSAQPGSARSGPAPQPADGRVRRVRAALIVLFPETPERGTPQPEPGHADAARSGGRRAVYVAAVVAVDAYLRRQAIAEGGDRIPLVRQPPWALTAVAALACVRSAGSPTTGTSPSAPARGVTGCPGRRRC